MIKSSLLKEVQKIYSNGENIIQFINKVEKNAQNSKEAIMISYDFQAGTYVDHYKNNQASHDKYIKQIIDEIKPFNFSIQFWKPE